MSNQPHPSSSSPRVPGGVGLRVAGAGTTLVVLLVVLVVLAVMGVMSSHRPLCQSADSAPAAAASAAGRDAIPAELVPIFQTASARYKLGADGWLWLAAFNRVETDFGRNLNVSSAGAIGWMQFMPATWAQYGVDANGDGVKDPWNPKDGIYGAANYLRALGAPGSWPKAAFGYNHAGWYVSQVTAWHDKYAASTDPTQTATLVPVVDTGMAGATGSDDAEDDEVDIIAAAGCAASGPAGGDGVEGLQLTDGQRAKLLPDGTAAAPADAPQIVKQMIAAANKIQGLPYAHYGNTGTHGTPYTTVQNAYDCSSSVAFILFHAGQIKTATENWVSGTFASAFGSPGTGTWVTLRANAGHLYIYIAGLRWDTHRYGANDTGPIGIGWHTAKRPDTGFTSRTIAGL